MKNSHCPCRRIRWIEYARMRNSWYLPLALRSISRLVKQNSLQLFPFGLLPDTSTSFRSYDASSSARSSLSSSSPVKWYISIGRVECRTFLSMCSDSRNRSSVFYSSAHISQIVNGSLPLHFPSRWFHASFPLVYLSREICPIPTSLPPSLLHEGNLPFSTYTS